VHENVGNADAPYRVTLEIVLQGSFGVGGSAGSTRFGSAGINAAGMHRVAYSHNLSAADKDAYVAAVSAGRSGAHPELQIVELIASGQYDAAAALIDKANAAFASAQGAAQLAEGDEAELGDERDIGVEAGAGRQGVRGHVGANVSYSQGGGLHRSIRRVNGKLMVTVTGTSRRSGSLGASGGMNVVAGGYTATRGNEDIVSVTVELDPGATSYAEQWQAIMAATDVDAVRAAAARSSVPIRGGSNYHENHSGGTTSISVAGIGVDLDSGSFYGEGEEQTPDGTMKIVRGGASLGGSVTLAGQRVNSSSKTDSFTGWVDEHNQGGGETASEDRSVDLGKTAQQLGDAFSANPIATTVAIATGNKPVLAQRVDTEGSILVDDSYARIAKAAEDNATWDHAFGSGGVAQGSFQEWKEVQRKVLAANGDRHLIAQAMAHWQEGRSGRSGDVERLIGDTGIAFEFPDEIADLKPVYDSLIAADPTGHARELAEAGDRASAARELQAINDSLGRLSQAVQMRHEQFQNPGKLAEMQSRIAARRQAIRQMIGRYAPAVAAPKQDANFVGPPLPEAMQQKADEEAAAQAAALQARRDASERIGELVGICLTNREKETQVFAAVADELDDFYINIVYVFEQLNSLKPMYNTWDAHVAELKTLYPKQGDSAERANQFAPNWPRWQQLRQQGLNS
jgi:hypothetical protein